jgi:hypothetical protein
MRVHIDTSFAKDFDVRSTTVGADEPAVYFPGGSAHDGRAGHAFEILPRFGPPWVAVFAPARVPVAEERVWCTAHPDGSTIGVVHGGDGIVVDVRQASIWSTMPVAAIHDVHVVTDAMLVVYIGTVEIFAFGPRGLVWRTGRLSWDGFADIHITSQTLSGVLWDSPSQCWQPFQIVLATGETVAPGERPE